MKKKIKKYLKQSTIVSIHKNDESIVAIPSRIITVEERDIMILLINNLPCDKSLKIKNIDINEKM